MSEHDYLKNGVITFEEFRSIFQEMKVKDIEPAN
jgi:hypothetical protein